MVINLKVNMNKYTHVKSPLRQLKRGVAKSNLLAISKESTMCDWIDGCYRKTVLCSVDFNQDNATQR